MLIQEVNNRGNCEGGIGNSLYYLLHFYRNLKLLYKKILIIKKKKDEQEGPA